jgi:lipopolysaccharide transport system ATP-binding protein
MSLIRLNDVSIEFPIFNATGRSLTSRILQVATGGKLDSDAGGRLLVRALEHLSFQISPGERVGIIGHNGAGKSTLLRAMSRVYKPTTGTAQVIGRVGSLIDISLGINPEATGRENIYIRGALLGLSKTEITNKFDDIVAFSELGDFIEMPVRTYSSGMHLRLAFSVATSVVPEILLMDEWLAVGDEDFVHKAEGRLANLVEATEILVLATHSEDLLRRVCNRAIWLERGRVLMDGPVDQVAKSYFSPK